MTDLGVPLDLLAHWTFLHHAISRQLLEVDQHIEQANATAKTMGGAFVDHLNELKMDRVRLQWCEAEAQYWSIRLDLEARYRLNTATMERVEDYLDKVSIYGQQDRSATRDFHGNVVKIHRPAGYDRVVLRFNGIDQPVYDTRWPPDSVDGGMGWVTEVGVSMDEMNRRTLNVVLVQP